MMVQGDLQAAREGGLGALQQHRSAGFGSERPSVGCSHRPDAYGFADALEVALAAVFEADT
jgi:hypothetical protein